MIGEEESTYARPVSHEVYFNITDETSVHKGMYELLYVRTMLKKKKITDKHSDYEVSNRVHNKSLS